VPRALFLFLCLNCLAPAARAATPPAIDASAWLLADQDSGAVLASHNSATRVDAGGLSTLMLTYVVLDAMERGIVKADTLVDVNQAALRAAGKHLYLGPYAHAPLGRLLDGVIVAGASDAALALATHISGSPAAFVELMNRQTAALGMAQTRFSDINGIDESAEHYTTAEDMWRLSQALIRRFPSGYRRFAQRELELDGLRFYSSNALLWRTLGVDGLIAAPAGRRLHLIASARRDTMRLTAVILGAPNERTRVGAGQRLLDFGFTHYETRTLYTAGKPVLAIRVWEGVPGNLAAGAGENIALTLARGSFPRVIARLRVEQQLTPPIAQGTKVGTIDISLGEATLRQEPLVALTRIERGGWLRRQIDGLKQWWQQSG
jgi:D-alanyl-D-alanine carboxypeptidase (penicillin-binding protein 5/6)